jgi:hypothetical protein
VNAGDAGDYQFIDIVPILERGIREGLLSRVERSVSASFVGWLIRLPGSLGVYEVLLRDHGPDTFLLGRKKAVHYFRTTFLLKYYPDPREDLFRTFSLYERFLRQSEVFDERGTPRGDLKQRIHESYFSVGEMVLVLARDQTAIGISLRSQEEWRERRRSPLSLRDRRGNVWSLSSGSIDRRVPGWRLSLSIFLPLLKTYVLRYGDPKLMTLSDRRGRVWSTSEAGTRSRLSPRIMEKQLDMGWEQSPEGIRALKLYLKRSSKKRELLRVKRFSAIDFLIKALVPS